MRKIFAILILAVFSAGSSTAEAKRIGPIILQNSTSAAGAGTLIGASAGLWAYGVSKNTNPRMILADMVIGTLTGTVAGTAFGFLEASNDLPNDGYTFGGYIAAGAGMGAMMGVLFATVPWALRESGDERIHDFYEGCIGAGLGGVIGGSLGLGMAWLDFSLRTPEGEAKVSGRLGMRPEWYQLADKPEAAPQFVMCCKVLEMKF